MRPRVLASIAVIALLGAACGSQPEAAPDTPAPATATSDAPADAPTPSASSAPAPTPTAPRSTDPAAATTVSMTDFDFGPATVEVAAGSTVTWTNDGSVAHTATVDDGLDTGTVASGESGTITFTEPGTYDYVCRFHPADMQAVILVR